MTTMQTTTSGSWDPVRNPIRVLPNAMETWVVGQPRDGMGRPRGRSGVSLTWGEARKIIADHAVLDGMREDVGAGALDKLAVSYDETGLLHICKTEQRNGQLVPASAAIPLRDAAFRHLAERAGAPAAYLAKLPAKLTRACLMHGLTTTDAPTGGLIRLAGGQARAIVSGRYAALDDALVLDQVERALTDRGLLGMVQVRGVAVGTTTVVRVTWARESIEVRPGDVIEGGIDIVNGEIGNRSVGITPSLYRLVCANGLRAWTPGIARRFNHVGDAGRLYEAFVDAIPAAIEEAASQGNALRATTEALIDDVAAEFEGLTAFGLAASEARQVARQVMADHGHALPESTANWPEALRDVADVTAYDVINGFTAYAQGHRIDRRLEVEEAAGRYLRARSRR